MRRFARIAFAVCLSQGLAAAMGLMSIPPAAAGRFAGPEAVWQPGPRFMTTVQQRCGSLIEPHFNKCFASIMQEEGPSPEAMAFARMLDNEGYLQAFRPAGPVDLAYVFYPFEGKDHEGILLVNGSPPIINVDELGSLPESTMKQDPLFQELMRESSAIGLWPGERSPDISPVGGTLKDGGASLDFRYRLLDGCRSCKVVGYAWFAFDFDPHGRLLGTRFVKVERNSASASGPAGETKSDKGASSGKGAIKAGANEEFRITLDSNATTGFEWDFAAPLDDSVVRFVSKVYEGPKTQLMGAGGKEVWTFRAVSRGKTEIHLKYSRPWEEGPAARNAVYSVVVE